MGNVRECAGAAARAGRLAACAVAIATFVCACGDESLPGDAARDTRGDAVGMEDGGNIDDASDAVASDSQGDSVATDSTGGDVRMGDAGADAMADVVARDGAWVQIVAPPNGTRVTNPAAFRIAAGGVTSVRMVADEWPMGAPWNPATRDNLSYTFAGPMHDRQVRLLGLDRNGAERARDAITVTAVGNGIVDMGTAVGDMYNTYYYLAREVDYPGTADTSLNDGTCMQLARVTAAFSDSVCIEGSGILADGRVINYSSSCSCGRACPTGGIVCYSILDGNRYPWGSGASSALVPLRSWAVDRTFIPLGTIVYVARWDGVMIPVVDGIGGFVHDGCFRADDTGGAIRGNHFDFFAGTRSMWRALERIFPTRTTFAVQRGAGRCAYLMR